ncbi:MAG: 4'-phosphopantetheinyl transferase superfamily protein [Actinomycetota bacterium]|nr:4'-phosphopantetheinyl transferase superfamily protein [Actinomycetota bacterium]
MYIGRLAMLRDDEATLLDEQERSRAGRYRFAADRARFVLGAVLLRAAAAHVLGVPAASIALDRSCDECGGPHGRPRVIDADTQVSVSHSGDIVAVALTAEGPVGVDVEAVVHRNGSDYREICSSVCTPDEQLFVTGREAFLTFWTRKEAVLKATGHGLRLPMTDVVVTPPEQQPALVSFPAAAVPQCRMADIDAGEWYRAAVAVLTNASVDFAVLDAAPLLRALRTSD